MPQEKRQEKKPTHLQRPKAIFCGKMSRYGPHQDVLPHPFTMLQEFHCKKVSDTPTKMMS